MNFVQRVCGLCALFHGAVMLVAVSMIVFEMLTLGIDDDFYYGDPHLPDVVVLASIRWAVCTIAWASIFATSQWNKEKRLTETLD